MVLDSKIKDMLKWKGFKNQIALTYWVNSNIYVDDVVSIVFIDKTIVLFYKKR